MNAKGLLALGALLAAITPALGQPPLKTDFYPLVPGYRWTYQASEPKMPQAKVQRVVVQVDREEIYVDKKLDKEGKDVSRKFTGFLLKSTSGDKTTVDHVVVMPDGVYRVHAAG